MFHAPVQPAPSLALRLRARLAPRAVGIVVALLIELALLLVLLSLGQAGGDKPRETVVDFTAHDAAEDKPPAPEPSRAPEAKPRAAALPTVTPPTVEPVPVPVPIAIPLPRPSATPAPPPARAAPASPANLPAYGPPDTGGSSAYGDTARVGTAPNGEPMYAAAWYVRPTDSQLAGFLSTADGPAWGLIACRTVPDFRVDDCVGLDEYPEGSHMLRAVLAAAWQFRVRPPRKGGELLIGSWVRIRIDYGIRRE